LWFPAFLKIDGGILSPWAIVDRSLRELGCGLVERVRVGPKKRNRVAPLTQGIHPKDQLV
jgi:hypothetical protein